MMSDGEKSILKKQLVELHHLEDFLCHIETPSVLTDDRSLDEWYQHVADQSDFMLKEFSDDPLSVEILTRGRYLLKKYYKSEAGTFTYGAFLARFEKHRMKVEEKLNYQI